MLRNTEGTLDDCWSFQLSMEGTSTDFRCNTATPSVSWCRKGHSSVARSTIEVKNLSYALYNLNIRIWWYAVAILDIPINGKAK